MAMLGLLTVPGSLLVVAVSLTGCSSPGQPAASNSVEATSAMRVCQAALRSPVVSATATTVGDIRRLTIGPGQRPAQHAFGSLADSSAAAWCWTGASGDYVSYGATLDGQKIELASLGGFTTTPSGPPVVP